MADDPGYERTARYYDAAYATLASLGPDAAFYQALAAETGGPVLELGCGTGRVLLPIAASGIECAGLDTSEAMLAMFRAKPGADAIELRRGRMQSFDLGAHRFRLVFSAFRAFQHLLTVEDQLACLTVVRAHLEPGGVFAFDVFNPRLDLLCQDAGDEEIDLTFELEGQTVRRFAKPTRDRAAQRLDVALRYVASDATGAVVAEDEVSLHMRWFFRFELEHLLYRAGFAEVEIYGDFDRSEVGTASPALLVIAR